MDWNALAPHGTQSTEATSLDRTPGDIRAGGLRSPAQDDAATWTVQSFHGLLNAIDAYIEVGTALRAAVEAARDAGYSWDILLTALDEDQRAAMRRFAD